MSGTGAVDLQIRKMPRALRDRLRERAQSKGTTMSEYVIKVLTDDLERPTIDEWLDELKEARRRERLGGMSGADAVRQGREEMERELYAKIDRLGHRGRPPTKGTA